MRIDINKGDVIWSYLGYIYKIAINLIMLPLTASFLSPKDLGLWFTFVSLGAFASLLDFGFLPTITRNITYSWSGAADIQKEGYVDTGTKEVNIDLFNALLFTSKRLYLVISLCAFGLLSTVGTIYILRITSEENNTNYIIAWLIYCLAIFLNIYYEYWNAFLRGTGLIKESQKAQIISISIQFVLTCIGLALNFDLIAIAVSYLMCGVVLRQLSKYFFYRKHYSLLKITSIKVDHYFKEIFQKIWHNAWRSGLTTLGSFIITQGTTLICSASLGLETTASYGLVLYLFSVISTIASIPYSTYTPSLNEARLNNDNKKLTNLVSFSVCFGWICFISCWVGLLLFGDKLLIMIHSKTPLMSFEILTFMGLFLFLEFNHSLFCNIITTSNRIPFVKASLLSGFSILVISISLLNTTDIGIWAIVLSQGIVQLSYNNWKWPLEVFRELNINVKTILMNTFEFIKKKVTFH